MLNGLDVTARTFGLLSVNFSEYLVLLPGVRVKPLNVASPLETATNCVLKTAFLGWAPNDTVTVEASLVTVLPNLSTTLTCTLKGVPAGVLVGGGGEGDGQFIGRGRADREVGGGSGGDAGPGGLKGVGAGDRAGNGFEGGHPLDGRRGYR